MKGASISTITGARIGGPGRELLPTDGGYDVFIDGGVIADIAPAGAIQPRGEVLDASGAWLIPGLWDHHVHVVQWALAAQRTALDATTSAAEAAATIAAGTLLPNGTRVGTGFRDALWTDRPTLAMLDEATGDIPTYLINADVHSVWMNSAAHAREGLLPDDVGMLREEPAFEISRRLNAADPDIADTLVFHMAEAAAARGVVGLADFDMAWNEEAWARRLNAGFSSLRVRFGIYPMHLQRALAEGLRTGDVVRGASSDLVRVGPFKVITDGSLGTRTAACTHPYSGGAQSRGAMTVSPTDLLDLMTLATAGGIASAVHAIGDVATTHALDAFSVTGATGTIEHAQLVAHAELARFARLGVGASVQPQHAVNDRDMTDVLWSEQTSMAYPLRSLADHGANLFFGSDAPVAGLDPWHTMASAVYRTDNDRPPWRGQEAVSAAVALAASTRGGLAAPATITPGAAADLVLCAHDPLSADATQLRQMPVLATLLAGRVTFSQL